MSKKSMLISEIEKATKQFKQTHKVTVSGPFNDEEMPKWFKGYVKKADARFERIEAQLNGDEPPKWFKKWEAEKFDPLVKRIDNLVVKNNLKE